MLAVSPKAREPSLRWYLTHSWRKVDSCLFQRQLAWSEQNRINQYLNPAHQFHLPRHFYIIGAPTIILTPWCIDITYKSGRIMSENTVVILGILAWFLHVCFKSLSLWQCYSWNSPFVFFKEDFRQVFNMHLLLISSTKKPLTSVFVQG